MASFGKNNNTQYMYMHNNYVLVTLYTCMYIHVLMRDEKEGRKKQANNKTKQHSTPKAVMCGIQTHPRFHTTSKHENTAPETSLIAATCTCSPSPYPIFQVLMTRNE